MKRKGKLTGVSISGFNYELSKFTHDDGHIPCHIGRMCLEMRIDADKEQLLDIDKNPFGLTPVSFESAGDRYYGHLRDVKSDEDGTAATVTIWLSRESSRELRQRLENEYGKGE